MKEQKDQPRFGWSQMKICLVSGIGFMADSYDLFVISISVQIIGYVYYPNESKVPASIDTGIKVAALIGTLIGQILFGYLGDRLGRRKIYGVELIIIIVATLFSCFAGNTVRGIPMVGTLIICRFFLGIGIGGDYPLSATITSEFAKTKTRGAVVAAVFAMQGFGIVFGSLVSLVVIASFKNSIEEDVFNLDYAWRIMIGIGCIPSMFSVYYRFKIQETPQFQKTTKEIEKHKKSLVDEKALSHHNVDIPNPEGGLDDKVRAQSHPLLQHPRADSEVNMTFKSYFGQWENCKILIGTSVSWFALDVAFYGINLNNPIIIKSIGFGGNSLGVYDSLYNAALGNLIISFLGTMPGYWFTVFFVDKWGRKTIQLMGFGILTVLFVILGAGFNPIKNYSVALFIVLFAMSNFFQNFGPNATTFIIPSEIYPTQVRTRGHGISAASGKFGSIIAQIGFSQMQDIGGKDAFVGWLIFIMSGFMALGFLVTLLLKETKGISLNDMGKPHEPLNEKKHSESINQQN